MPNKLLLLIVVLSLILASSTFTRGHYWGDDFASYIMQAKSILNGTTQEFVEHNSFTIFESSYQIGPVTYPWGYPLILMPVYAMKGTNPLALKLPGLFFYGGFLICLYFLIKNRLTRSESLLLISLFAFNPQLLLFLDNIFSDVPFLFFVMLALLWTTEFKANRSNNVMLGIILFFAYFVRTTGIILVASFLLYQGIRFFYELEKRSTILFGSTQSVFTFGILWITASMLLPDEQGSYLRQMSDLTPIMIKESVSYYFFLFGTFFGTGRIWEILYYTLVCFFVIGIWDRRAFDQPLIIFFTLYIMTLIFWPYWQGLRFIFPLLPLFVYFTFQGMKFARAKLPKKYLQAGQWMFLGFWSLTSLVFLVSSTATAYTNLKNHRAINGPFDPYSLEMYEYIQKKTPLDSIIIFFKPRLMRLMTDRDSIMSIECNHMSKGDYLVLYRKAEMDDEQIQLDDLGTCNLQLDRVFKNRRFFIYKLPK